MYEKGVSPSQKTVVIVQKPEFGPYCMTRFLSSLSIPEPSLPGTLQNTNTNSFYEMHAVGLVTNPFTNQLSAVSFRGSSQFTQTQMREYKQKHILLHKTTICLNSIKHKTKISHLYKYSDPLFSTLLKHFWQRLQPRVFLGMTSLAHLYLRSFSHSSLQILSSYQVGWVAFLHSESGSSRDVRSGSSQGSGWATQGQCLFRCLLANSNRAVLCLLLRTCFRLATLP